MRETVTAPALSFQAARGGDARAREALIRKYEPLVGPVVRRVMSTTHHVGTEWGDLVSAGMVGLVKAVDRFDPGRGVQFESFAISSIRGEVLEVLRNEDFAPRSVRRKIKPLEVAAETLESRGITPTPERIAELLQMDVDEVHETLALRHRALITEFPAPLEEDPSWEPEAPEDTFQTAVMSVWSDQLRAGIDRLPPRQRTAVILYYYENMTCLEVGIALGVSDNRAYQIIQDGVKRLGKRLLHLASLVGIEQEGL